MSAAGRYRDALEEATDAEELRLTTAIEALADGDRRIASTSFKSLAGEMEDDER